MILNQRHCLRRAFTLQYHFGEAIHLLKTFLTSDLIRPGGNDATNQMLDSARIYLSV